uniref:Uncharacterized protein n=1 Tax=Rhizophora mucronata TaxID=61149 RepID=A0A2P2NWN5_RHIMU
MKTSCNKTLLTNTTSHNRAQELMIKDRLYLVKIPF